MTHRPALSNRRSIRSDLEPLEPRIAPAGLLNPAAEVEPGGITAPNLHVSVDDNIGLKVSDVSKTLVHGGEVIYTISYFNDGSAPANVTLTEIPDGRSFYIGNEGWNNTVNGYTLDVGSVAPDGVVHTVTFTVATRTTTTSDVKSITNEVSISQTPAGGAGLAAQVVANDTSASISTLIYQGIYVTAPGVALPGHYAPPTIRIFNISLQNANSEGSELDINAYPASVRDSLRTAVGDFNGDGFDDVIVMTEHGKGSVKLFDGETGQPLQLNHESHPLAGLRPFGAKGGFVAAGDLTSQNFDGGEGYVHQTSPDDVVFGSSLGGGAVKIYNGVSGAQIGATLYPFGKGFTGGVRVAIGDIDKDSLNDVIVAQGNYGNKVLVYRNNGDGGFTPLGSFKVGGNGYNGGVNLSVGNVDGFGPDEIVVGHNRLSAPTVEVWHYQGRPTLAAEGGGFTKSASFNAFSPSYQQGVRVALADVNLDGTIDIIAAAGWQGKSAVNIFDGRSFQPKLTAAAALPGTTPRVGGGVVTNTPEILRSFTAYPESLDAGVWVSGSVPVPELLLD